jgi:hypothetical protein
MVGPLHAGAADKPMLAVNLSEYAPQTHDHPAI